MSLPTIRAAVIVCVALFFSTESGVAVSDGYFEGDLVGADAGLVQPRPWPRSTLYYVLDADVGYIERRAVKKASKTLAQATCVKLRPKRRFDTSVRGPILRFVHDVRCWSYLGVRVGAGGRQNTSVGCAPQSRWPTGAALHTVLHALGLRHETTRVDRGEHVLIAWGNVLPDRYGDLAAYWQSTLPYDLRSLTHYGAHAFAKHADGGDDTATVIARDERVKLGQRDHLTSLDILKIEQLYCGGGATAVAEKRADGVGSRLVVPGARIAPALLLSPRSSPSSSSPCADRSAKCALWASSGRCVGEPTRMRRWCPAACRLCDDGQNDGGGGRRCADRNALCGMWAWLGRCRTDGDVLRSCPLACGLCLMSGARELASGECADGHPRCAQWQRDGRCFYTHVGNTCRRSCRTCAGAPAAVADPRSSSAPVAARCSWQTSEAAAARSSLCTSVVEWTPAKCAYLGATCPMQCGLC